MLFFSWCFVLSETCDAFSSLFADWLLAGCVVGVGVVACSALRPMSVSGSEGTTKARRGHDGWIEELCWGELYVRVIGLGMAVGGYKKNYLFI